METIIEPVGAQEQVIAIIRTEGAGMRPDDLRCRANIAEDLTDEHGNPQVDEDGVRIYADEVRCENEIAYDLESDGWGNFCAEHRDLTRDARHEGRQGPVKVSQELIDSQFAEAQGGEEE